MTDATEQNNTGPLGGPVIILVTATQLWLMFVDFVCSISSNGFSASLRVILSPHYSLNAELMRPWKVSLSESFSV